MRCKELQNVYLIIDDDDRDTKWFPLTREGDRTDCRWTAYLGENGSISTTLSHFSLRVDLGRTYCHIAGPNEKKLVAELIFGCCSGEARNVHVKTEPPMPVSYLRSVPKDPDARSDGIACTEVGTFPAGNGTIRQAQFSDKVEEIFLQFGALEPKRRMLGLRLNDIVVHEGTLVLLRDGVVYQLMLQRAKGQVRSAPTFSSNAISLDIKRLEVLKLESAEIEVIK